MERTERYPRKRQARWDRLHLKTVSTHLTVQEYERLKTACQYRGRCPYELLRLYLLDYTETVLDRKNQEENDGRRRSIHIDGHWQ